MSARPIATTRSVTGIPTGRLAVWWVVASEIVIFGGILASYVMYRLAHDAFAVQAAHTSTPIGAFNTFVLLTSSLFAVLGHKAATAGDGPKAARFLVYTALGVAAGLAGEGLAAWLQTPAVLALFAAMLALFALSMFGVYELRLPSSWSTRISEQSQRLPAGQVAGVFGMGAVSALIVSPCVSAPLAGALVFISQTRDVTLGGTALFSLAACILAAPLLIQNQFAIGRAISANEAEISAFTRSYKAGLERLSKIGALSRIEVDDAAVTHYIGGPLYEVGPDGLAKYARAAMVYQTLILGEPAKPVILRDALTEDAIGTFRTDGVFVVQTKRDLTQAGANH